MPRTTSAAAALAVAGVVLVGCSSRDLEDTRVQTAPGGAPMAVSCEPTQRAIVRPIVINGAIVSQVECTSAPMAAAAATAYQPGVPAPMPVSYATPVAAAQPASFDTTNFAQAPAVSRATPRRVSYQPEPVRTVHRPTRSVAKSALIIGSSAGAGAGLGALIGGKKGALIGAAAAGGGATLWDQITRHKDY
jgi:hypothetical protein